MSTTSVVATIIPRSLPIVPCFANHFVPRKQVQESYTGFFILVEVSNDSRQEHGGGKRARTTRRTCQSSGGGSGMIGKTLINLIVIGFQIVGIVAVSRWRPLPMLAAEEGGRLACDPAQDVNILPAAEAARTVLNQLPRRPVPMLTGIGRVHERATVLPDFTKSNDLVRVGQKNIMFAAQSLPQDADLSRRDGKQFLVHFAWLND